MADWDFNDGYRRKDHEDDHDFEEEDVWSSLDHHDSSSSSPESTPSWRFSTQQNIPKKSNIKNTTQVKVSTQQQSSAPVNVPDWSKIYGHGDEHGHHHHGDEHGHHGDGDDDDGMVVPPHEWVARRLARSKISSFSVCEGVGRTLKGRDLSKVRNAILTKTGFLE